MSLLQSQPQWALALIGGLLIGLSAALYLLLNGRIAGISGMTANALGLSNASARALSVAFIGGLIAGTALAAAALRTPELAITSSPILLAVAGLLVGYGTRLGAGCTSGHGVCGLARLSPRSIAATLLFMTVAIATVFVTRHVLEFPQ